MLHIFRLVTLVSPLKSKGRPNSLTGLPEVAARHVTRAEANVTDFVPGRRELKSLHGF